MEKNLIPQIIKNLTNYNRRMYDYGKNIRHYGTNHELRIDQTHIIDYIGHHPGCRLGAIATDTDSNLPTVSLQVKRLIKLGLVSKTRSEQDQREIILTLTEDGTTIFKFHEEMDIQWASSFSKILSSFSGDELTSINHFMEILLENNPNI